MRGEFARAHRNEISPGKSASANPGGLEGAALATLPQSNPADPRLNYSAGLPPNARRPFTFPTALASAKDIANALKATSRVVSSMYWHLGLLPSSEQTHSPLYFSLRTDARESIVASPRLLHSPVSLVV